MLNTYVGSSNIERIGYKYGKLFVEFKSGASYVYANVDKNMYDALVSAESVGKFFNKTVRTAYQYQKLDCNPFGDTR